MKRNEAFEILGLNEEASEDDVKKSFRKLAAENHPDKHKGEKSAEDKFKQINQAYQILLGKEKAEDEHQQFSPFGGGFDGQGISIEDIMNNFMGFGRQQSHYSVHTNNNRLVLEDIFVELHISFEEAVLGCTKNIEFNVKEFCKTCEAQGTDPNKRQRCSDCAGVGHIRRQSGAGGFIRIEQIPCPSCFGRGITSEKACPACIGKTYKEVPISVNVKVPPIDKPIKLQLKQKGHKYDTFSSNAIIGVIPQIEGDGKYKNYYLENNNVKSSISVSLDKLLFGGKELVQVVGENMTEIEIKPLTKVFDEIIIKDKGVRSKKAGNHVVIVEALYPEKEKLTDELKSLLENCYK